MPFNDRHHSHPSASAIVNTFGLPELCYVYIPGREFGEHIGIVKFGELGYYPARGMTIAAAQKKNEIMGVTDAQRDALMSGSMFGWHVPGTNPAKWHRARKLTDDRDAVGWEARAIQAKADADGDAEAAPC